MRAAIATSSILFLLFCFLLGLARATTPSTKNPKPFLSPCAWSIELSPTAANALLPDGGASYWVTPLVESNALSSILPIKGTLDIKGFYPSARYFSFVTYTAAGEIFDSIVDYQIPPLTPGTNPFATKGAAAGAPYSLRLVEANGTQAIQARADGETVLLVPKPAGSVLYRIYGADPNTNATGGQPLPSLVSTTSAASKTTNGSSPTTLRVSKTTPPCAPNKFGSALAVGITSVVATAVATLVPAFAPRPQPLFARSNASAGGLFYPNPDNAYLAAFTDFSVPGRQLALWRGEMFLFPDTEAGQTVPPPPPRDVRFSSLCHYKYSTPFPLVSCASDWQMTLDSSRRYTVVSGHPKDKPSDAVLAANFATWVPALEEGDSPSTSGLALFRTMLPSAGFDRAAQSVPKDSEPSSAAAVMKQNYPKGVYCSSSLFASGGYDACVAAAVGGGR